MTKKEKTILFDTILETHRLLWASVDTEFERAHRRAYLTLIDLRDELGLLDDYVTYQMELEKRAK